MNWNNNVAIWSHCFWRFFRVGIGPPKFRDSRIKIFENGLGGHKMPSDGYLSSFVAQSHHSSKRLQHLPLLTLVTYSVTSKKSSNVYNSCLKMISQKIKILTPLQKFAKKIWANWLLPKALKSCPKSNKSPNLVTLSIGKKVYQWPIS